MTDPELDLELDDPNYESPQMGLIELVENYGKDDAYSLTHKNAVWIHPEDTVVISPEELRKTVREKKENGSIVNPIVNLLLPDSGAEEEEEHMERHLEEHKDYTVFPGFPSDLKQSSAKESLRVYEEHGKCDVFYDEGDSSCF